ncbi:rod shape-determining protein MreD [Albibacterium indicum]|uniref:rod shape-determining protein MreD n=1 Tax=Albibacterium indicum TaxID=2292082 RepID=UPI000E4718C8|nr:rod shape-determining protein MreD [Pedobacter indicus]
MAKLLIENIIRFLVLILAQVFLFKNIGYYNLASPFPYIMALMLLPARIPKFFLFTIAFLTGITVDAFYDTLGVHAAACVTLAWARIVFINLTLQDDDYETSSTPGISQISFRWFFIYAFVLSFFHHFTLYLLEVFSLNNFLYTLTSILFSCIFTTVLIVLFELILYRRKKR